ncbi:MAG: CheR family methyltransferase [Maritimibacter harenae]|jgi:chemotaxis protein methyltransferase CheR
MAAMAETKRRQRFEQFRALVHDETGIKLPPSKNLMVESRLRKRLVALGVPDLESYLERLFSTPACLSEELPAIIDLMTTNKTDFFREEAHFRIMRERLIPEALSRGRPGQPVPYRVWSAAASTGAEAWSAAMILAQAAQADPRLDWAIVGTDLSTRVLAIAETAVYSAAELAPVPSDYRKAFVMTGRGGASEKGRIAPELRARVRFSRLNLKETPYGMPRGLDLIFLRNVLIYFEPAMQHAVIRAMATHLRKGGYLIVGHSESMIVDVPVLEQIAPGVFRNMGGQA